MLTCCRDRWVVVGPAARIYWSHRDCKCLTTAILTATVPHIAPRRKRHYVNIIQISHNNLLPRFKLVSLWKKAPSEMRVAPWMETCFRCFESVLPNSLLLVCQFSFREDPFTLTPPPFGHCPFGGGGLNACPDGFGHLFREELSNPPLPMENFPPLGNV